MTAPGRAVSLGALGAVALAAWAYTAQMGATMPAADAAAGMRMSEAAVPGLGMLAGMWIVMMVAMMAPAMVPSYLVYARMDRGAGVSGALHGTAYLGGYLACWISFGVCAAALQHWLGASALISGSMALTSPLLAGGVLFMAGAYQWSPLKTRCAARCRSPLGFFLNEWRPGTGGAWILGWRYGLTCVGCCWLLMGLMFVVGAMNLAWALALSAYVLLERLLPFGRTLDRIVGVALAAWGAWLVFGVPPG